MIKHIKKFHFASKKQIHPPTLPLYDILIIGSNTGSILANYLHSHTNGLASIFIATGSPNRQQHHLTIPFELGFCKEKNYFISNKCVNNPFMPHSDGVGVKSIDCENNVVVLDNNREIGFKKLVISNGLEEDFD